MVQQLHCQTSFKIDKPRLLLVNYHYIRDPKACRYPGIHPVSPKAFSDQLLWLKKHYRFATPDEVERFVLEGEELPGTSVFLTFDDGLIDHWEAVKDVLDPMGIKGAFFVCSRPALEQRALAVHKIHWLRSQTEPEHFASEFFVHMPENMRVMKNADWSEAAERMYVYDPPHIAVLKFALNFVLPLNLVDDIASDMLAASGIDEREFCRQTYMNEEQLRALSSSGHVLGVHGHSHEAFSRLGDRLMEEVETSAALLARVSGATPRWISYPNGREDAIPTDEELDILFRRFDFRLGFTLCGTWNDGTQEPRRLRRINTNEVEAVTNLARSCRASPVTSG